MLLKTARYSLIDVQPLNLPIFAGKSSYLKVDNSLFDESVLLETLNIIKTASKTAEMETDGDSPDFDLEAEIRSHPDSLFVKCFAIKADETNDNGDHFQKDELQKATGTFVGCPVFTNHNNSDAEESRGKVVHSWWNDERNGIMIIARVDAEAYPKLARGIKEEYIMGCFPPDAPVLMADGTEKNICDIEDGDIVISGKGNPRKVLGTRHRAYDYPLLSIKVEGIDQPLVMTSHHNVVVYRLPNVCVCGCGESLPGRKDKRFTRQAFHRIFKQGHNSRGKQVDYKYIHKIPAHELRINDLLVEPKILPSVTRCLDIKEKEALLVGLFLAEGSYEKRNGERHSVIFNFGFTETETLAKRTSDLLEYVFINHRNKPTIQVYPEASQSRVCLHGKDVAEWFHIKCGEYSDQKHLNAEIFLGANDKCRAAIIAGYIEGDGWNVKGKTYGLTTASPKLSSQFRSILSDLGVRSRYRVRKCEGWGYKPVHEITFGISTAKEIYKHLIYKQADHGIFDPAAWHSLDDMTLRRIKVVQEVPYKGIVYDLEIEEDHTYCVNHIAVSNTSMGCQVQYSVCSICHAKAENQSEYCSHIRERKTRKLSEKGIKCKYHENGGNEPCPICDCKKGETQKFDVKDEEVFEFNYGIKFIENSFVVNPACHDCGVTEIIDPQEFLKKVAIIQSTLPRLLKAAASHNIMCCDTGCVKFAGQNEIDSLNQALDLMTTVSQSMLQQKDQLDLEFLSDLVTVLSDLQTVTDELTQQGYARLPSPAEQPGQPGQPGMEGQGQDAALQPLNPTPGGGSKIQSGSAGEAGTVTSPMASRRFDMTKIALALQKESSKTFRIKKIFQNRSQKRLIFGR